MNTRFTSAILCVIFSVLAFAAPVGAADRKLVARHGKGYLETVDGYRVLHLKGTPQEMGAQHGALLKDAVCANVEFLLADGPGGGVEVGGFKIARAAVASVLLGVFEKKVPERFSEEMKALAEAAGLPEWKVRAANLIPEVMHCSGFALLSKATATGKLYHGRVLDYGVELKLQDHAVLIIQEPDGGIPFVNVSYAGFIGSVTGMNMEQISIGEMGGGGVGWWDGIPMSFLVRMVLEDARTLDEAIGVFQDNPRTCEYYYVIADARADSAVGIKAVPEKIEVIRPGEAHPLLPTPVADTVLMSAGDRYGHLARLAAEGRGTFTEESAIRLMDAPVAMKSNLHNALMAPADGVIYVANAAADASPAWRQKYYRFDIRQLLREEPTR
ncbi:MAG: peptidase C45 [Phycisphaerae bacterium]|nr:peptidase C45 [Phycisphaerae bacterium]